MSTGMLSQVTNPSNNTTTMKSLLKLSTLAALTTSALAGAAEVASTTTAEPWITGSITATYETSYYFRGLWFSNNNIFNGVNLSAPLADNLTLGFGALYTQNGRTDDALGQDLEYSELDLIGSLTYETDFATFGLVVTNYHFFDTFSGAVGGVGQGANADLAVKNALDIGLTAKKTFGDVNVYLGSWFDTKIDAWYFEAGIDYTYEVNEKLSLVPLVQMGYGIDYYVDSTSDGEGLSHVRASLSAPYKMNDAFTVTPYVAGNFALETRKGQNLAEATNDLFGGISASYAF
jgi:hypothetical protein